MKELLKKLANALMGNTPETDTKTRDEIKAMLAELDKLPDETGGGNDKDKPADGDESSKQLLAIAKELKAKNESLEQQLKTLLDSDADAKKKNEEAYKKATADKAKAKIDEAIKAGRIAPKQDDLIKAWTEQLEQNFEQASKLIDAMPATTKPAGSGAADGGADAGASKASSIPVNPFSKYVTEAFTINN